MGGWVKKSVSSRETRGHASVLNPVRCMPTVRRGRDAVGVSGDGKGSPS